MQYYSTRDINLNKTFEEIIIQSLCKSGGLYLPMDYPTFNYEEIFKNNPSYNDIAYSVLSNFIGSSIKDNDLKNIIKKTSGSIRVNWGRLVVIGVNQNRGNEQSNHSH